MGKKTTKPRSLRVMLADLKYFNKYSQHDIFIPLNLGYLVSHARKVLGSSVDISIHLDATQFLDQCLANKPDVIGFAIYTWNLTLTKTVIRMLRERLGDKVTIIVGGPSVGENEVDQIALFNNVPGVDALVPGEGEIGFVNILKFVSENGAVDKRTPIQNAILWDDRLVYNKGKKREVLDLNSLDSPYLTGALTSFMQPPFQYMIQTTRGCPYTCTFCVKGADITKVRKFPLTLVKSELIYLAKQLGKSSALSLFVVDDNFGIFKEDIPIAESIIRTYKELGYPTSVGFYTNKRVTEITKKVSYILRDIQEVYFISLQSDNPEVLKHVKRKNVPDEQIRETISWMRSNGLSPMTELIFGLPCDTRESFVAVIEKSISYGFDRIHPQMLTLLDGAEVNRNSQRIEFGIQSKYRLFMNYYGYINGTFTGESEEIVTSSNSFSFEDFLFVRYLSFMLYSVYSLHFNRLFFKEIIFGGIKITDFFHAFFFPDKNQSWPEKYLLFLSDLKDACTGELYDTKEELVEAVEQKYIENDYNPLPPTKINNFFGSRLVFHEKEWHSEVLGKILKQCNTRESFVDDYSRFDFLLEFQERQLINPSQPTQLPDPMETKFDFLSWMDANQADSLANYKTVEPQSIEFHLKPNQERLFLSATEAIADLEGLDAYYALVEKLGCRMYYSHGIPTQEDIDYLADNMLKHEGGRAIVQQHSHQF